MWIGDEVEIFKYRTIKRGKKKLTVIGTGFIVEEVTRIGLGDEISVFLIELSNGDHVEYSEDFLRIKE